MSAGAFAHTALKYLRAGFSPIPVVTGEKRPAIRDWTQYCETAPTEKEIVEWIKKHGKCNIGIALGGKVSINGTTRQIVGLDVDDEELVEAVLLALPGMGPAKKGRKGITVFCLCPVEITNRKFKRNRQAKPAVELLAFGSHTVVPPSIHPEGMEYQWWQHSLLDTNINTWPLINDSVIDEISAICHGTGEHFHALNTMVWLGVGGGGDTHDTCVSAVASLVSRGWSDSDITERVVRAKQNSVERSGDTYDWPSADEQIREWINSARNKGFTANQSVSEPRIKKAPPERLMAEWALATLGGPEAVRSLAGKLLAYQGGHWPAVDIPSLLRSMYAFDPFLKKKEAENAIAILSTLTEARDFGSTPGLEPRDDPKHQRICLLNGTLNLRSGEMEPWNAEHEILHQIDTEWDSSAECPIYDRVTKFTFNNDERAIETWDEYCALTLVDDMTFQKVLFLRGPGGNGKGTLARVLRNLHSPSAVGSVAVTDLNDERKRTSLVGKLVNISGEQSRFNTVADTYLKKITGGDPVDVRRLYGETVNNVSLTVRFIELVNEMPATNDASAALRRRLILLDCPNRVLAPDPDLDRKLMLEKPGVLRRWTIALNRLYQRGDFDLSDFSRNEVDAYLTENDPVIFWVAERLTADEFGTPSKELFADFHQWFIDMDFGRHFSAVNWGRRLTAIGYPSIPVTIHKGLAVRMRRLVVKPGLEGPI